MVKTLKLVLYGSKGCGKTAILEQLIYGTFSTATPFPHTIEDTYVAHIESERGVKEKVRFYEIGGCSDLRSLQVAKHFVANADALVLVYDTTDPVSFLYLDAVKREIEKNKERREAPLMFVLGNKTDLECKVTAEQVNKFVSKEKVNRHFKVSALNRRSLVEAFVAITTRMTQTTSKPFPFVVKRSSDPR